MVVTTLDDGVVVMGCVKESRSGGGGVGGWRAVRNIIININLGHISRNINSSHT